jgi:hypothetical protein
VLLLHLLTIDALHAASQAEVTDLNSTVIVNQDISWLQVTMDDLGLVKVVQTAKDVVNNRLDLGLLEVLAGLDELL